MSLFGGITLPGEPCLDNIARLDLLILSHLNKMSRYGIAFDIPYLRELDVDFSHEMDELSRQIGSYVPRHALDEFALTKDENVYLDNDDELQIEFNPASAEQTRKLVFDLLSVGRDKKLKTTGGGKVSTGRKNMDLCRQDHPVIPLIIQYREYAKLRSSFCRGLLKFGVFHPATACCPVCELPHVEPTWRLHTTFTTTRAITGRLSSRRPNLQQISIRSKIGAKIRAAFLASRGCKLVSVDFSQMEIRDLAHLANARSMIEIYLADGDIHMNTAMKSFGITDPKKVDKYLHRLPSKRVNFGIQNGTQGKGLHAQLVSDYWAAGMIPPPFLTVEWCAKFIDEWHVSYPEVQPYFETQWYRARRYGFVWNPWGRTRYIPQVRSTLEYKQFEGCREAQNFAVTSSNAEQTKLAMAELEQEFNRLAACGVWVWPLLSIHDQEIAEVGEEHAELVGGLMTSVFEHVMDDRQTGERLWRCPIKSDCEVLDRWKAKD